MQSFSYNIDKEITDMRKFFQSKNKESQRGSVIVEFAIILPLILLLFAGITEFGIAYYNKQIITNASREGARAGIANTNADITGTVRAYANPSRLITFGSYTPPNVNIGGDSQYLIVTVTFNYTYILLQALSGARFFGANFGIQLTIEATTVMERI